MRRSLIAVTLFLGFIASAAQPSTQEVWQRHINAWNARNVGAIVADYSDTASIIINNRVYRGKAEIRSLFQKLFGLFDKAQKHEIDPAVVTGKMLYITWRVTIGGMSHPLGTDTFVIEDGKITYQTITSDSKLFAVVTAN